MNFEMVEMKKTNNYSNDGNFSLKLCRRHLNASTTHMQTDWWWQWISLNTFYKTTLKINRFNVYGYKDTLFPYAWISGVCRVNAVDSIMHPNGKPCILKTRENGVKTSYSSIAISPSSEKDVRKKHASKNNRANGTECMSTFHKICSHISNHIWHSYLNKFDAMCSPWKWFCYRISVSVGKLWPEAVVIVTWDFMLCIFFVSIDTWQLNSLIAWLR